MVSIILNKVGGYYAILPSPPLLFIPGRRQVLLGAQFIREVSPYIVVVHTSQDLQPAWSCVLVLCGRIRSRIRN